MGSGKSTVAPLLAQKLGYNVLDIDEEIEKIVGLSVKDIFQEYGVEYFRLLERTVLQQIHLQSRCVIALGGGTITQPDNLKIIKSSGILVYLKTDPHEIIKRVDRKTDRPLLQNPNGGFLSSEELQCRIRTLLEQREPFYNHADIIVQSQNSIVTTVDEIVREIQKIG